MMMSGLAAAYTHNHGETDALEVVDHLEVHVSSYAPVKWISTVFISKA